MTAFLLACGPGNGGADGGTDAANDVMQSDASSQDVVTSDTGSDAGKDVMTNDAGGDANDCVNQVSAVIDAGCTRCWPADLVECTEGNPGAVVGMLHCLAGASMCWDEGDYNTAGPCMQTVIDTYGDSNVTAIGNAINALPGCPSEYELLFTAVAAEMSNADRATFATCIEAISPDAGCAEAPFDACLGMTHWNASLCQN
jgi:hypothetical protein